MRSPVSACQLASAALIPPSAVLVSLILVTNLAVCFADDASSDENAVVNGDVQQTVDR